MGLEVGVPVVSPYRVRNTSPQLACRGDRVGSAALIAILPVDVEDAAALDGVDDRTIESRWQGGTTPAATEPPPATADGRVSVGGAVDHDRTGEGIVIDPFLQPIEPK